MTLFRKLVIQKNKYCISVSVLIFSLSFFFICGFFIVIGASMEPTFAQGNVGVISRVSYYFHDIERGDIVSFYNQEIQNQMIKRVIGIGGDKISFYDGYLFINDQKVEEAYLPPESNTYHAKTFYVPEGHIFVMGDNRTNSTDSRHFRQPFISEKYVLGKFICYLSPLFHEGNDNVWTLFAVLCATYITASIPSIYLHMRNRQRLLRAKQLIIQRHELLLSTNSGVTP